MKYDFGGWATRNDLLCADGRTIRKDAFKAQDGQTVPLVWNHNHSTPENILGLAHLENRDDGIYAYCEFNNSEAGKTAKEIVNHGDIRSLSIFANQLMQNGKDVLHGLIREVSLVLAGANPGAFIDNVMAHGDNGDSGIILCYDENITLYHSADEDNKTLEKKETPAEDDKGTTEEKDKKDETLEDVFNTLNEKQKTAVYAMLGQTLDDKENPKDKKEDDNDSKEEKTL